MTEDVMKTEGHTPWPKLYFIPGDSESNAIIFPDDAWNGPNFSLTAVAPDGEEDRLCADVVAAMNERSALLKCEEALRALLTATIEDCGDGDNCPDDHGGVALHADGSESAVTFPQIRAARAALTLLDEARK